MDIKYDRIESFQNVDGWPALRVLSAVNAVDGNAGGCILCIRDVGGVQFARDPVLGTKDRIQRDAGGLGEDVDGAASLRVNASLVGQESDFLFAGRGAEHVEVVGLEHVDSGLHRSVTRGQAAGSGLGLVVSGDAL